MNDDDDIAATLNALPHPDAGAAPSDDDDIAQTLAGLDHAPVKSKPLHVDLSKMPFPDKVAHWESSGNASAKAPTGSATGSGQFINTTWVPLVRKNRPDLAGKSDADILAMRSDPDLSRQMIDAYGNENAAKLQASGVPVSDATKYGAHWFGPDNYTKIHNADPKTPIENIIGNGAAANNGLSGKTAGDVKSIAADRMGPDYQPDPPARDWGDTIEQAGENLLPSIGKAAAGIGSAIIHPIDTATTLGKIGIGLASKVDGYAGKEQDPEKKAKDEELVDALANSYKEKYGSIDGFKKYLAEDPAGVLMDLSTILGGGGTVAARLPGMAGKAGEIAAEAGKIINPLNPAGVVSGSVKALTTPASVLDKAGNVIPKVDAMIKKVTNGTMSGADLVDPDVKAAFASAVQKKGVSEASVKEGILRSLELKAPSQSVTGIKVPEAAREATAAAIEHNNAALDARSARIGGTASSSDLGAALDQAHTSSLNNASAAYDKIRSMPGSFGATMPEMPQLAASIKAMFKKSGIPAGDFQALSETDHPQAAAAIKLLKNRWGAGKTLMGNGMNGGEVLAMRKALNNFKSAATGSDIKAVSDISDAVDGHVSSLSNRGFFVDSKGQPVQGLSDRINKANAAYKAHFNTFDQSPNPAMRGAVQQLKAKQTFFNDQRMPSGDVDAYTNAQGALGTQLMHPTKGANTYNQLKAALGGNSAPIDNYVRSTLLNGDKPIKNAAALLNNPNSVVSKTFASSPADLAEARHVQAARDINNAKPTAGKSGLRDLVNGLATKGAGSIAGYETLGAPGLLVGPAIEHLMDSRAKSKALKGAPHTSSMPTRAIKAVARRLTSPVGIAAAHYKSEAQKEENKISRASGGKVDHEALVTKLISRWKKAKKATDETTKPLLHVPDATIVKALDIAQEHI